MSQAIFRSVGQAVHFSFLLEALEASSESLMARMMREHLISIGAWKSDESTINFGGLTSLEIRAQAAMIRSACRNRLTGPEFWVVLSRYGMIKVRNTEGHKAYWIPQEKADALGSLADWLSAQHAALPPDVLRLLVLRATASVEGLRPTFRDIAEKSGCNKDTLCRHAKKISHRVRELETFAFERLEPTFLRDGVVEA